jgi:hypothetical protein
MNEHNFWEILGLGHEIRNVEIVKKSGDKKYNSNFCFACELILSKHCFITQSMQWLNEQEVSEDIGVPCKRIRCVDE